MDTTTFQLPESTTSVISNNVQNGLLHSGLFTIVIYVCALLLGFWFVKYLLNLWRRSLEEARHAAKRARFDALLSELPTSDVLIKGNRREEARLSLIQAEIASLEKSIVKDEALDDWD